MDYPIAIEYEHLDRTRLSEVGDHYGRVSEDELRIIDQMAHDAANNEAALCRKHYTPYNSNNSSSSRCSVMDFVDSHTHPGLRGARVVRVTPYVPNPYTTTTITATVGPRDALRDALRRNDFTVLPSLPGRRPTVLRRWRVYDGRGRLLRYYPWHNLVWEDAEQGELYGVVPQPPAGLERRAYCDHCRGHDSSSGGGDEDGAGGEVPDQSAIEYFDARRHVGRVRAVGLREAAVTPFCVCRFHWAYIWLGILLRPSQVHALERLLEYEEIDCQGMVQDDLRARWGIAHTREFLDRMHARLASLQLDAVPWCESDRLPSPDSILGAGGGRGPWRTPVLGHFGHRLHFFLDEAQAAQEGGQVSAAEEDADALPQLVYESRGSTPDSDPLTPRITELKIAGEVVPQKAVSRDDEDSHNEMHIPQTMPSLAHLNEPMAAPRPCFPQDKDEEGVKEQEQTDPSPWSLVVNHGRDADVEPSVADAALSGSDDKNDRGQKTTDGRAALPSACLVPSNGLLHIPPMEPRAMRANEAQSLPRRPSLWATHALWPRCDQQAVLRQQQPRNTWTG